MDRSPARTGVLCLFRHYLIDVKFGIIMDVEASRAIRQAEVGAAKTMIKRTEPRFDIKPERLAGDTAYGSGANLDWLVNEAKIAPHIPVVDKSKRKDGTFISTHHGSRAICSCRCCSLEPAPARVRSGSRLLSSRMD